MAPGPDGTLFVSIPRPGGSVLALLDRSGRPRPGWPIAVSDSTSCELLLPIEDGSVRVVCTLDNPGGNMFSPISAFAFDREGRPMTGWPIDLGGSDFTGRTVGDILAMSVTVPLSDVIEEGQPSHTVTLATIAADGSIRSGTSVPMFPTWPGDRWSVGPDGIAYGVVADARKVESGPREESRITALDLAGERTGWPVSFDGIASGPAFGPDGRIVVTVGSFALRTSRVLAFDPDGETVSTRSAELPIATGALWDLISDGPYECGAPSPRPPLVARDGTVFVFSEIDTAIVALAPSLEVIRGWPFEPATRLERPDPRRYGDGINCTSLAIPAVGPDATLYLPLQARDATVGGSLVAVGSDGRARPGWPVELRRPGAEFWSVVVGSNGTIYALAVEPEAGESSSASILAIAPDSTVLYTTTIIEP